MYCPKCPGATVSNSRPFIFKGYKVSSLLWCKRCRTPWGWLSLFEYYRFEEGAMRKKAWEEWKDSVKKRIEEANLITLYEE